MDAETPKRFPWRRVGVALAVTVLLVLAWRLEVFQAFHDPDRVRGLIGSWGPWAYVLYVATFIALMPFGVPAFVWVLPAGVLWPFWVAYSLSLLAVAGASSVGFFFARYLAREWVAAHMPPRIRRIDQRFAERGVGAVIVFRLVFQLGAPTHWVLGLSRVSYPTFLVGTVIGAMPAVALVAWLGHDAFHWAETHVTSALILLTCLVAAVVLGRRLMMRRAGGRNSVMKRDT